MIIRSAARFGELTDDEVDKFAGVRVGRGLGDVPTLVDCPNRLVLRRTALLGEGGDHVYVVGEVVDACAGGPFSPLLLSQVRDLNPGHEAEERPAPPTNKTG